MTIPILSTIQPDAARSPAAVKESSLSQQPGATDPHRQDERDFAAAMSEAEQDNQNEPARPAEATEGQSRADESRRPEASRYGMADPGDPQDGREGVRGNDTSGLAAQDAPRRQVTIPDLPARRSASTDHHSTETINAPHTATAADENIAAVRPDPAANQSAARATQSIQPQPATAQTVTGRTTTAHTAGPHDAGAVAQTVRDAPQQDIPAFTAKAAPNRLEGAAAAPPVQSDAKKAQSDADMPAPREAHLTGATAGGERQRSATPPPAQIAAEGSPVAQAAHATAMGRAAPQPTAEDRFSARFRDPMARAIEAVAATPAIAPQTNAAQSVVAAQALTLQPAARDATGAKDKIEALLARDGEPDGLRFDLRGSSGSTSTQQGSFVSALGQTLLPRGIAMQLGDIVRAMPDRPVEVALSPEELGRVRLSISTSEGGVILHVLAERPETLDLMRRHADQLARELANLGFGTIDLAFGQGRDPDSGKHDETSGGEKGRTVQTGEDTDTAAATGPVNRMTLSPSGGLDIRI